MFGTDVCGKEYIVVKLVVIVAHKTLIHAGAAQTLAETRKSYRVQGRSVVRKIIWHFLLCIHWEGGPYKTLHGTAKI